MPAATNVTKLTEGPTVERTDGRNAGNPPRFSILMMELPGGEPVNAGVLLEDPSTDRLYVRLRRDWDQIAPQEAEVFQALEDGLRSVAAETGAVRFLDHLEDRLSNTVRVSDREPVPEDVIDSGSTAVLTQDDFERALARLYRRHVRSNVLAFVTHLPRYTLAVAAGKFLDNQEVTAEGWEEAPADLKVSPQMFVARIAGRSMQPRIPDGSLCVFRQGVVGSREGRLVLVEALGRGANDRYTVKRYHSVKTEGAGETSSELTSPDTTWTHQRITLQPLNPEFEAWDLNPEDDRYRIIAEFVRVLD
jgi:SOS-response transcriptional repressor LexA